MIKLNNKNITYVALADSNNSVKGVKEIWYADSSNSVKLVYRRKDALIEGEDYEKYHWLDGDGSAYIDTLITDLSVSDYIKTIFDDSANLVEPMKKRTWGREGEGKRLLIGNDNYSNRILVWGTDNFFAYYNGGNYVYDMYFDLLNNKVTVNNQIFNLSLPHDNDGLSLALFTRHLTASTFDIINRAKFKSFEIHNQIKLIPCKLLKPVPKWLDANGIRRNIGECGMIDLVSGKFYGNVNSVGTFTVENYYERKEWLQGDGSAYIDTNIIVNVPTLYISTKFTKSNSQINEPLFGSRNTITGNGSQIFYPSNERLRLDVISHDADWATTYQIDNINTLVLDCTNRQVTLNGTLINGTATSSDMTNKNSVYTFKIFSLELLNKQGSDTTRPFSGALGNFILNDGTHLLNLTPCTLTMDLPASMDANNIARTKGTSGMWDLVSDRFYGNVANSGTFKAVNLAEGVDYEVHDWLVGDGSAYIDTLIYDLTGKSIYCKLERNAEITDWTTTRILGREGDSRFVVAYANNSYTTNIALWTQNRSYAPRFTTTEGWIRINFEDNLVETHQSSESIETYTIKSSNLSIILFGDRLSTTTVSRIYKGKIGQLTVNQAMNLIPIKLLKSIPSKYDANGIARQAGECGMYDTVNDVFYGNVASSGTFTVSDDS